MKKLFFLICAFSVISYNFVYAKTYDLSQISQVKLVTEYSDDTYVDEMDTVTFGSYPQSDASGNTKEPIEWIVLDRQGDKVLLLSKYILDCKNYNNERSDVPWETCTLRKWLNNDFYHQAFNSDEILKIEKTIVINTNNIGGIKNSNDTYDNIFICGVSEIIKYFGGKWSGPQKDKVDGRDIHKLATKGTDYAIGQADGYKIFDRPTSYGLIYGEWSYDEDNEETGAKAKDNWYYGNMKWGLRDTSKAVNEEICNVTYRGTYSSYIGGATAHWKHNPIGVRPALWIVFGNENSIDKNEQIPGLPSRESELRSDNRFYLDNNMQKSTWVYYRTYYYHVDGSGNIQKNQWIELRYVGEDGRMYRGRQTPDGKWVGDDGLVVDVGSDLSKSLTIEAAEPDSWYKTQSGLWYYFENDRTTTKKGWFIDSRDNQTYYLDPKTGIMAVGWTKINGSEYYFNESHDNEPNWYETGGGFYESYGKKTKAYGSMFKNETTPDGKKVGADGKLITNEMEQQTSLNINRNNEISSGKDNRVIPNENFTGLKDGYYYLNGVKLVNKWVKIEGKGYYFDSDGKNYKFNP